MVRLPFEPPPFLRKLTQRGLEADADVRDASVVSMLLPLPLTSCTLGMCCFSAAVAVVGQGLCECRGRLCSRYGPAEAVPAAPAVRPGATQPGWLTVVLPGLPGRAAVLSRVPLQTFLFVMCQSSLRPLITKLLGWGPSRAMSEVSPAMPRQWQSSDSKKDS